jgi:hypothetical protein
MLGLGNSLISSLPPGGIPYAYLLDDYSGAIAGYSLRKLVSTYSGNCISVRGGTTGADTNIGFAADGTMDIDALQTYATANNTTTIHVTTWYDQSGTAIANMPGDVLAGTVTTGPVFAADHTRGPVIATNGVINLVGGQPSMTWAYGKRLVATGYIEHPSYFISAVTDVASKGTDVAQASQIVGCTYATPTGTAVDNVLMWNDLYTTYDQSVQKLLRVRTNNNNNKNWGPLLQDVIVGEQFIAAWAAEGTDMELKWYSEQNGAGEDLAQTVAASDTFSWQYLGANDFQAYASMKEFIMYDSDMTATSTAIIAAQADYFGV